MPDYEALTNPTPVLRLRPKLDALLASMGGPEVFVETVAAWRSADNSWTLIAAQLEKDHGVKVSHEQVRQWYITATRPEERGGYTTKGKATE